MTDQIDPLFRPVTGGRWRPVRAGAPRLPPEAWPSLARRRLMPGDLLRVRNAEGERLWVYDGAGRRFVALPAAPGATAWVSFWEGGVGVRPSAVPMLRECRAVEPRRVILAACDVAARALPLVPRGEGRPRAAVEAARALAEGLAAPPSDVRRLRREARDAADAALAYATSAPRTTSAQASAADAAMAAQHAADAASSEPAEAAVRCAVAAVAALDGGRGRPDRVGTALAPIVRAHVPLHVLALALAGEGRSS